MNVQLFLQWSCDLVVFAVMKQSAMRWSYLSVWTPPSLAQLPAFIAAFIELIEARLLSAGTEPELNICRYANELTLAALLSFSNCSQHGWDLAGWVVANEANTPLSVWLSVCLSVFVPPLHLSTRCSQSHLILLLPSQLSVNISHFPPFFSALLSTVC